MSEKKKFSMSEMVVGGMFILTADILAAILDFVPTVGWVVATIIQATVSGITTFWLWSKGGKRAARIERQGIKHLSNLLPWVPTCFAAFIIEVSLHNNPDKFGSQLGKLAEGDE